VRVALELRQHRNVSPGQLSEECADETYRDCKTMAAIKDQSVIFSGSTSHCLCVSAADFIRGKRRTRSSDGWASRRLVFLRRKTDHTRRVTRRLKRVVYGRSQFRATIGHDDTSRVKYDIGSMFKAFRYVAILEGVTTLALFFVAMPAKYFFDFPDLVPPVGTIHGWAFLAYLLMMIVALWGKSFTVLEWARTTIASFFPFGTFLNDSFLKRKEAELSQ